MSDFCVSVCWCRDLFVVTLPLVTGCECDWLYACVYLLWCRVDDEDGQACVLSGPQAMRHLE